MVRRLGCQKLVAALDSSLATVVGVRRAALALFTAIHSLLVTFGAGEAVERPHEQHYGSNGQNDSDALAHSLLRR
jgi:hypothetical protein